MPQKYVGNIDNDDEKDKNIEENIQLLLKNIAILTRKFKNIIQDFFWFKKHSII